MSIESNQTRASTMLGDASKFAVTMINLKDEPLFAKLFQGFEVDTDKSYSIPWRFTQYAISGPDQRVTVTFKTEYAWVWGTGLESDEFVLAAFLPCKLGDSATLSYDTTKNIAILTSTPANSDDKLTIGVAAGFEFPAGWYVGFGIIGHDGNCHPLGVVDVKAGFRTIFKPKTEYKVAFVESVNNGIISAKEVSESEEIVFTNTGFNHATCTFNRDNSWTLKYSSDAGADN